MAVTENEPPRKLDIYEILESSGKKEIEQIKLRF